MPMRICGVVRYLAGLLGGFSCAFSFSSSQKWAHPPLFLLANIGETFLSGGW
jgi:hypothetical protein